MREATDDLLVVAREISKTYRPKNASPTVALRGVSMELVPGEAVAVVGPSRPGKSTLLSILWTLEAADGGSLLVLGRDVTRLNRSAAADLRFERIGRRRPPGTIAKAEALLDRIGLGHKRAALPRELSGGEQQRVCIARALVTDPDLILADEPTGNLDSHTGAEIMSLLLKLNQEQNLTLVIVTHDPSIAAQTQRVIRLHDGLIEDG